jgi:hypothetical protein
MELVIGGLIAFLVEMLLIALLLAPRWTLRTLARPFHALVRRLRRSRHGRLESAVPAR